MTAPTGIARAWQGCSLVLTHEGQVWPISLLVDAMYETAWGPYQKGNTHYYISSGLGIWGGKYRIGTRSEYIVATIVEKHS